MGCRIGVTVVLGDMDVTAYPTRGGHQLLRAGSGQSLYPLDDVHQAQKDESVRDGREIDVWEDKKG